MRLPGNTRPGSCAIQIEPGTLCERLLPCDARCELKWWRLIVPAKPLPIVVPCTSTFWPTANTSTRAPCAPALYSAATSAATRNSWMISPASTPALARWPASRLGHARGLARAEATWSGGVAVGLGGLDLGDAVVRHVEHGDGDGVAVIGEDAHHAHLAAQQPEAIAQTHGSWSSINVLQPLRLRGLCCNARHRLAGLT